jgi:hypothetical protein
LPQADRARHVDRVGNAVEHQGRGVVDEAHVPSVVTTRLGRCGQPQSTAVTVIHALERPRLRMAR